MKMLKTGGAVIFVVVFIVGCGGGSSDKSKIESTLTGYLQALAQGDGEGACSRMSGPENRSFFSEIDEEIPELHATSCADAISTLAESLGASELETLERAEIQSVKIEGGHAMALAKGATTPAELAKEGDAWVIVGGLSGSSAEPSSPPEARGPAPEPSSVAAEHLSARSQLQVEFRSWNKASLENLREAKEATAAGESRAAQELLSSAREYGQEAQKVKGELESLGGRAIESTPQVNAAAACLQKANATVEATEEDGYQEVTGVTEDGGVVVIFFFNTRPQATNAVDNLKERLENEHPGSVVIIGAAKGGNILVATAGGENGATLASGADEELARGCAAGTG